MTRTIKSHKSGKIRVSINVEGADRELFSLIERKSGDIMVLLKAAVSVSTADAVEFQEVKEQRFSVHVSPKSQGHTIKQTLRTAEGPTTTSALVMPRTVSSRSSGGIILRPRKQFCWPIFMVRPPSLNNDRYLSSPKPADQRISLGSFNPKLASLTYMVIVTSPHILEIATTRNRTNLATILFSTFNIHVMYGFSIAPIIGPGDFVIFATSPQRAEGEKPKGLQPAASIGLPAVEGRFFQGFGLIRDLHGKRFLPDLKDLSEGNDAMTVWGLSAICVRDPPTSGIETMRHFDEYMREVDAFKAANPIAVPRKDQSLDWLYGIVDNAKK